MCFSRGRWRAVEQITPPVASCWMFGFILTHVLESRFTKWNHGSVLTSRGRCATGRGSFLHYWLVEMFTNCFWSESIKFLEVLITLHSVAPCSLNLTVKSFGSVASLSVPCSNRRRWSLNGLANGKSCCIFDEVVLQTEIFIRVNVEFIIIFSPWVQRWEEDTALLPAPCLHTPSSLLSTARLCLL